MGEQSDGVYLTELAERFGKEYNEPFYAETMNLFIKEENFHSAYLAWYLKYHDEPKAKKNKLTNCYKGKAPKFVPADYHLAKGSPCINKGTKAASVKKLFGKKDLDGKKRIKGKSVDIGCYEY